MAIYRLKRKVFALTADGGGVSLDSLKTEWTNGGGKEKLGSFKDWYKGKDTGLNAVNTGIKDKAAKDAAMRAANKANADGVKNAAMRARTSGYNAGMNAGMKQGAASVGIKQGALNSWNRMGTMGKVGTVGALAGGALLAGKALFGGKKKEEED